MWPTIISIMGPLFVQWIQSCGKDPVAAAQEAYDPATDTFSESAIRGGMIQTHHAIRLAKRDMPRDQRRSAKFSKDEIREQTIAKMREGLTATPATVAAYAAAAAALPDVGSDDSDE